MKYNFKTAINISAISFIRWMRSSRFLVFPVLLIVIFYSVAQPLRQAAIDTGSKISFLEPFIALSNSSLLLLIIPFAFLGIMADFPPGSEDEYLIQLRCDKKTWICGQAFFAFEAVFIYITILIVSTIFMVTGYCEYKSDFSTATRFYSNIFPERRYGLVKQLIPGNLYNQLSMKQSFFLTTLFLFAYLFGITMLIMFLYIIKNRFTGVLFSILIIIIGLITSSLKSSFQWIFPMAHTIIWLHFREYYSQQIFPIWASALYLTITSLGLLVLCVILAKRLGKNNYSDDDGIKIALFSNILFSHKKSKKENVMVNNADSPIEKNSKKGIILQNVELILDNKKIIKNVSLTMEYGKIYGLVGNNGSGKTMLMKLITGIVQSTDGIILVNGRRIGKDCDYIEDAGVIIENPVFLPFFSGIKNLMLLAGLNKKVQKADVEEAMACCGLDPKLKIPVRKYSLGMRQRLGICQAIMEKQSILILDEPMNGLDKSGINDIRNLLLRQKNEGRLILLASHNKEDIELLCDTVFEVEAGSVREIPT